MGIIEGGVVILDGVPRHINPFGNVRRVQSPVTIQSVVDVAAAGDVIYIEPGTYAENVIITTADLTLVGIGPRGQVKISPASGGGLKIDALALRTVLINLAVAGAAAANFALNVNGTSFCRFYGCKFTGPTGVVVLLDGTAGDRSLDLNFEDCEFADGGAGVEFDNSAAGFPTEMRFRNCLFQGLTAACMRINAAGGGVLELWVKDCEFARKADGTEPTDYILVNRAGDTGLFSGNRIATPINSTLLMTIAAGIIWAANATEAGWSTARPV